MRVLIVEDDPSTRDMLERGLREELFQVETAAEGAMAELRAVPGAFDVIILDVMLPDHDGFEVCRRLRAAGVDTPILLLTGRQAIDDRVRGLDTGADDYLAKPFAFRELLARLRAVTRRGRGRHFSRLLAYGPIEIDQSDRTVRVAGTLVAMTATEYRLLEYFVLRAEALITREELAQHVWGEAIEQRSNTVDVYVGYLRKKLKSAGRPLLRTVRRVGYTLKEGRF